MPASTLTQGGEVSK